MRRYGPEERALVLELLRVVYEQVMSTPANQRSLTSKKAARQRAYYQHCKRARIERQNRKAAA